MKSLSEQDLERLAAQRTIDLTTYGRRSGLPRRIEIWWFHVEGRFVITGTPGRRDWLANVSAHPEVIIHAGGMDIPATAQPISDPGFRRRLFTDPEVSWYRTQIELDRLVADAPMIEVLLETETGDRRALPVASGRGLSSHPVQHRRRAAQLRVDQNRRLA